MKIAWIGLHNEGIAACRAILEAGWSLEVLITHEVQIARRRSGEASEAYKEIGRQHNIRVMEVDDINSDVSFDSLDALNLDLVFVIGWNQILSERILKTARLGMIGTHASLLPHNRGSAPINWTLIHGEKVTGNTLIWLRPGVDTGEIIDQMQFPITPYDTCHSLYQLVAETNREMILRTIPQLRQGEQLGKPQLDTNEEVLPRRRPRDGQINWSLSAHEVYNFIRALTHPYPGAFTYWDEQKVFIWGVALLPTEVRLGNPGEVIGPVYSPDAHACGQLIACGQGGVIVLDVDMDGESLRGVHLSNQSWLGKVWSNAEK